MQPSWSGASKPGKPKLNPPILEAHLENGLGFLIKFRWHQTPAPQNEQVSIFYYKPDGAYEKSSYINRNAARNEWNYLLTVGYFVAQQPTIC